MLPDAPVDLLANRIQGSDLHQKSPERGLNGGTLWKHKTKNDVFGTILAIRELENVSTIQLCTTTSY